VNGVDMRNFDRMGRGLVATKSLEVSKIGTRSRSLSHDGVIGLEVQ